MSAPPKRRALGRGLSALIPSAGQEGRQQAAGPKAEHSAEHSDDQAGTGGAEISAVARRRTYFQAAIEEIYPTPDQPRKRFVEEDLDELADSIRAHGIIQPLIVRARTGGDSGYWLIAGERRWRAAQRAGLHEVPVVVQEVDSKEAFERALVENLQRADLNPMEEAEAYHRLMEEFHYTQEQVAERVGKDRSTVANSLRLLRLPENVRRMVEGGDLSMGHARALLGLETSIEPTARRVLARGLSVRATEKLVKQAREQTPAQAPPAPPKKSASVRDVESRLSKALGADVTLEEDTRGKGGRVRIRYLDLDDLDRLLDRLLT